MKTDRWYLGVRWKWLMSVIRLFWRLKREKKSLFLFSSFFLDVMATRSLFRQAEQTKFRTDVNENRIYVCVRLTDALHFDSKWCHKKTNAEHVLQSMGCRFIQSVGRLLLSSLQLALHISTSILILCTKIVKPVYRVRFAICVFPFFLWRFVLSTKNVRRDHQRSSTHNHFNRKKK